MTDKHRITDEQLGKEIGYLIRGRVESATFPAGTYLAIQDRLGNQDTGWLPTRLLERLLPGGWRLPANVGLIAKVVLGVIVAAALVSILIWQGRDTDQGTQPAGEPTSTPTESDDTDVPNLNKRFDLSELDATTTEAEIIRLLGEDYVMYTRLERFSEGGIFIRSAGCIEQMRSIPQIVCEGYPETVVEEWWESTDSSGTVDAYFGRMTTTDGALLATGIQGEWTDAASGEEWSAGRREGRELVRDVGITFAIIEEKIADGLNGTESEFAGGPSLIFSVADEYAGRPNISFNDGEFEYQDVNPFFQRKTNWRDHDDGTREKQSETKVLDFAMLPPGSLPEFAVMPPIVKLDVPNMSDRLDLSGMDAATIQAEFIRLLGEGHVVYMRMERFGWGGAFAGACTSPFTEYSRSKVVCDSYPGRMVRETWESTDSSGIVQVSYGRESTLDGTVLAIKIQDEWTHIASGESWLDGRREDFNLIDQFGGISTVIDRGSESYPEFAESEYLGKPSIIFADVFEYQIQNPMLWRQVRRQELGDGMSTILSEARFTDVAMLPPGSFPGFAVPSAADSQMAEKALLAAHQAGLDLSSYSVEITTGFDDKPAGAAFGSHEFHRPSTAVVRNGSGDLTGIVVGTLAYSLDPNGTWCSREIERQWVDGLSEVPDSLDRITRVKHLENGDLLIEGIAADFGNLVNDEYPSIGLHRFLIDSTGYVTEWKFWRMLGVFNEDLLSKSTEELIAVAATRKQGPWDAYGFGDFDELDPVGVPEGVVSQCSETPSATPRTGAAATPTPDPGESFTVNVLDLEPKIGTVFEKLLSKMPDNEITRGYTRLGDVAGVSDALGLDRLRPGFAVEDLERLMEEGLFTDFNGFYVPFGEWPAEQRDYMGSLNTFPDLAFDWASVDQFAQSNSQRVYGAGPSTLYDVALGSFDVAATTAALNACDCEQPAIRERNGIEYFAWSAGDGIGDIKRRLERPFYDHIGRGPHLLVRDGEAYYAFRDGVIDEHIDVIQGTSPSLAEIEDYVSAVQWVASMGIVSEITLRNQGFTVDDVVEEGRGEVTPTGVVQGSPLMSPFSMAATGIGYDGERPFVGLVLVHQNEASVETNLEILLARIRDVTPARIHSNLADEWSFLVDQIDAQASGRFLVARIYLNRPGFANLLSYPNTLLVHE